MTSGDTNSAIRKFLGGKRKIKKIKQIETKIKLKKLKQKRKTKRNY